MNAMDAPKATESTADAANDAEKTAPSAAEPQRARIARAIAATCAIVAMGACAALLSPLLVGRSLCAPGGGCDKIAQTSESMLFGVPRSAVGVLAFAAALLVILSPGARARKLAPLVGALAAVEGLRLIALQLFVYKAICPYCMVADTSALVMFGALVVEAFARPRETPRRVFALRFAPVGAFVAVVAPVGYAATRPAPRTEIAPVPASADGHMVLREFVDLQCPYCRATHVALKKALANRPDIVIERHHVPFPQHEHALGAAVAACCAGEQGAEERFIDAVVADATPPDAALCRKVAASLSLDTAKFDACCKSQPPLERIKADMGLADETAVEALPTMDLEGERVVGALDEKSAGEFLARHPKK